MSHKQRLRLNRGLIVIYDPAKFRKGATVRIADRPTLDQFFQTYKLHHRLQENQLQFAGHVAKVRVSAMYHGGDMLYELEDVPGIWHERLLDAGTN
jgi:hypothetical protein